MLNSSKKILIINDFPPTYAKPFSHLNYGVSRDHNLLRDAPEKVALVVFTGGSDVSSTLYDTTPHYTTFSNLARDMEEIQLYHLAKDAEIPLAGICRGAQFLCVMAGGVLVQDITGHTRAHKIKACSPSNKNINIIDVTSSHHQMQYPAGKADVDFEVLAWGVETISKHYALDDKIVVAADKACIQLTTEPDVIWYPKIKALAAQYHPEWMHETSPGFIYFRELVDYYLVPLMEANETDQTREKITQTAG